MMNWHETEADDERASVKQSPHRRPHFRNWRAFFQIINHSYITNFRLLQNF